MLIFDKALEFGLRPYGDMPRNSQSLIACKNLRATARRLRQFAPVTQPFTNSYLTAVGIPKTWPFPQLFRCNAISLLMESAALWVVDEDGWTLTTSGTMYKPWGYPSATETIPAGGVWHVADFYNRVYLFNGNCMVYQDATTGGIKWHVQKDVTINTGCAHKEGRMFYGGFDPSDYYSASGWGDYIDAINANHDVFSGVDLDSGGPGQNWVWWSNIGGGDFLWQFQDSGDTDRGRRVALYGQMDDAAQREADGHLLWAELMARNQSGMRPMPFRGEVQKMIPMGENVIVYGEDGVAALRAMTLPDGTSTYGLHVFPNMGARLGVADRGAASGGDAGQVFIDTGGTAWMITPDLQAQKLGYQEHFSKLLDDTIVVEYDPFENEYWIGNGDDENYVLTTTGLSKAPEMPTTVSFAEGGNTGIVFADSAPTAVQIRTERFDGGEAGVWEIETVRLGMRTPGLAASAQWVVYVLWRLDRHSAWKTNGPYTVDERGVVRVKIVGCEFIVDVRHTNRVQADLDHIEVEIRKGERIAVRRAMPA